MVEKLKKIKTLDKKVNRLGYSIAPRDMLNYLILGRKDNKVYSISKCIKDLEDYYKIDLEKSKPITIKDIEKLEDITCKVFELDRDLLYSDPKRSYITAKFLLMRIIIQDLRYKNITETAKHMTYTNHSIVLFGLKKVHNYLKNEENLRMRYNEIIQQFNKYLKNNEFIL